MPYEAFHDLRTDTCRRFNQDVPDVPGVRYFSVAGVCEKRGSAGMGAAACIVHRAEGRTTGVVSVASATWGEQDRRVGRHHLNLVNWPNRIAHRRGEWPNRAPGLRRILRTLAETDSDQTDRPNRTYRSHPSCLSHRSEPVKQAIRAPSSRPFESHRLHSSATPTSFGFLSDALIAFADSANARAPIRERSRHDAARLLQKELTMRSQMFAAAIAVLALRPRRRPQLPTCRACRIHKPSRSRCQTPKRRSTRGSRLRDASDRQTTGARAPECQRCNNGAGSFRATSGRVRSGQSFLDRVGRSFCPIAAARAAAVRIAGRRSSAAVPRPLAALHLRQLPELLIGLGERRGVSPLFVCAKNSGLTPAARLIHA